MNKKILFLVSCSFTVMFSPLLGGKYEELLREENQLREEVKGMPLCNELTLILKEKRYPGSSTEGMNLLSLSRIQNLEEVQKRDCLSFLWQKGVKPSLLGMREPELKLACLQRAKRRLKGGKTWGELDANEQERLCYYAVDQENGLEHLKFFLKKGADPNLKVQCDTTPLLLSAVEYNNIGALRLLLRHGSDLFATGSDDHIYPMKNNTILMAAIRRIQSSALRKEGLMVSLNMLQTIMDSSKSMKLINCRNSDGDNALNIAYFSIWPGESANLKKGTIDYLLEVGENPYLEHKGAWRKGNLIDFLREDGEEELANYMELKHKEFKKGCASRLSLFLTDGEKSNKNLSYGPFPPKCANKIAAYRYCCEDDDQSDFEKRQGSWLGERGKPQKTIMGAYKNTYSEWEASDWEEGTFEEEEEVSQQASCC